MNVQEVMAKAERVEGLTVEEVKIYEQNRKPQKHVYGKYGTIARLYIEEHDFAKYISIVNMPEYLHGIDRQADELYEAIAARLSKDERYKRTGDFMTDYKRQTGMQRLIEEEILGELVYVD